MPFFDVSAKSKANYVPWVHNDFKCLIQL